MKKLNVAVVGLGWVATNRHIPIILRHPELHLYGVVDKREDRLERIKEKYPWLESSLSENGNMPWANQVDVVLIATDPPTHYPLAKNILQAGKHLLMEKPLTMNPDQGKELNKIALQNRVSFCVVHNFQFARSTIRLKKMIQAGDLGNIQSIEAIQLSNPRRRLPSWYEKLPFGLFYDESPHMFYMLESLANRQITLLSATTIRKNGQETPVQISAHYAAGEIPIRLSMNFESALSEWHIVVQGTQKVGIIDVFRDILVTLPNDGQHRAREILKSSFSTIATHLSGFFQSGILLLSRRLYYGADQIWQLFIDEVKGKSKAMEISGSTGIRIVEMQHEIMNHSHQEFLLLE